MPEIRKDPVTGQWVIIRTFGIKSPQDFVHNGPYHEDNGTCALCEGNENMTANELTVFRRQGTQPNKPGWWVRVIPNRLPSLRVEGQVNRRGLGMFDMMTGIGAHEIIVESPKHHDPLADRDENQIEKMLWAYHDRVLDLRRDRRLKYMMIFKNFGRDAGARINHPHSQLIATPVTPMAIKHKLHGAQYYFKLKQRCIFCDMIRQEQSDAKRVVSENKYFICITPYASRFPFGVRILPKTHNFDFIFCSKEEIMALAMILKDTARRLRSLLNDPSYNMMLYTSPNKIPKPGFWETIEEDFHWHIDIFPRLGEMTGAELGTDLYINPVPPESAADMLREVEA
jgi:UDPglucose--hexose-1-phosphate uridylyltransferase